MIDQTTPCRICNTPTPMLGTRLCHRCWELETRIKADPDIAEKVILSIKDSIKPKGMSTRVSIYFAGPQGRGRSLIYNLVDAFLRREHHYKVDRVEEHQLDVTD